MTLGDRAFYAFEALIIGTMSLVLCVLVYDILTGIL
jgi:hypothetical protein